MTKQKTVSPQRHDSTSKQGTSRLEVLDSGVVYRNPNPGYRYNFACHSYVVQISPQELICTYQRGQALYSVDSVCAQSRSTDGGKTWVEEPLIYDPRRDDRPYSYHGPLMTQLSDGTLVLMALRIDRSDPTKPLFNETSGGMVRTETILLRSKDRGATWSEPEILAIPDALLITPSGPMVVLANGLWFQAFDQWPAFDAEGPFQPYTLGLFSADGGRSWNHPVNFANGVAEGKGFWHGRIIRQHDDRLFTLFWSADLKGGKDLPLHYCMGSPDGREWTIPQPTNIYAQTNWCSDLGNSRIFAVYTVRKNQPPGFFVTLSEDGGKTWDLEKQVMIWDATGRDKIGTYAPESYPRSHDTIAYGAPTAISFHNGDILVSFWCTELSVTHIRYARLRLAECD